MLKHPIGLASINGAAKNNFSQFSVDHRTQLGHIRSKSHTVTGIPGHQPLVLLLSFYISGQLPLVRESQVDRFSFQWEGATRQQAKAIIKELSKEFVLPAMTTLDLVRRIHQYRATSGGFWLHGLLTRHAMSWTTSEVLDEQQISDVNQYCFDAINDNRLRFNGLLMDEEASRFEVDMLETVRGKLGDGMRRKITQEMIRIARLTITYIIELTLFLKFWECNFLGDWALPFLNDMVSKITGVDRVDDSLSLFLIDSCVKDKGIAKANARVDNYMENRP